jgi:hypothetical protein
LKFLDSKIDDLTYDSYIVTLLWMYLFIDQGVWVVRVGIWEIVFSGKQICKYFSRISDFSGKTKPGH